jgi:hypothetical protein
MLDDKKLLPAILEVSRNLKPLTDILEAHNLTPAEYQAALNHSEYRLYFDVCRREWEAAGNTQRRNKLQAATGLEYILPHIIGIVTNPRSADASKIDAAKLVAQISGVLDKTEGQGSGSAALTVNIDLGSALANTPIKVING